MPPDGSRFQSGLFYRTITAAVADFAEHGFDSQARLDHWLDEIRTAAMATLTPEWVLDRELRAVLGNLYAREVERGTLLKRHPGIAPYTWERVKPRLRQELDKRIRASADLIRLNRPKAVETTLARFAGWASSIPDGGSDIVARVETKQRIRKSLAQLPFEERRVAIDQGHKLIAALDDIVAQDGGALAGVWKSNWRQRGYDYRDTHKARDGKCYMIRGNWAAKAGYMKADDCGYTDEITQPAQEPFCRCHYAYVYNLKRLPDGMRTEKGRAALVL